ncbi:glycosyltransferase [Reyranella sp.]|uniref:glycosyltransferase n=1 Tax=Reyranella sp. TaxID=1929291 RepID=UPI003C7C6238
MRRAPRRVRYVPRHHLVALIKAARALLFPSLYEGFGLPVLEAMVLGTPVITSSAASLPEIAGDAALIVDPYSSASIRHALMSIDADADLRRELAARGPQQAKKFSATAYDDRLRTLYQQF